jgi:hypothetical protein
MPQEKVEKIDLFEKLKADLLKIDPCAWCETNLTLEGEPFRLHGNGYRPLMDIYRYIGIKALEPNAKPVIWVKGRQVGATICACALEMYFMGSGLFGNKDKPPIRVLHAFPQLDHAAAYSKTKLNQMITMSRQVDNPDAKKGSKQKSLMQSLIDQSSSTNDSLTFKQFQGGNHLWVESTGIDSDRIMGRSCDIMLFDEIQKIPGLAIGNALKILTASKYGKPSKGVQFYFGTPRRKGSDYHKMWQSSTQQYYHLGCEKCHQYFPLYTPGSDSWKKIWLHGYIVQCPHCGQEQDKRDAAERGKWFALRDENDPECRMIGFHLNQLYMPRFQKEDILGEEPGVHPINTERVFHNEVLGEFYQGDASPITPEEIREMCGEPERRFVSRIEPNKDQIVVMGIDYGLRANLEEAANPDKVKSIGISYSVATIMLVKGPKLLSIEFALKFKRNDPASKKELIDQLMRQYSVNLCVGDIGYSNDFSQTLHTEYGDRYLVSRCAGGKLNDFVKFRTDTFPKEIVFDRDHYIGEFIDLLKGGNIKFPLGDYERIAWLIDHCSSMELKPSISRFGDPSIHYVKGGSANDGLMSALNAYIAYKFIVTKGFTTNNPLVIEQGFKNREKPLAVGGYISRRI